MPASSANNENVEPVMYLLALLILFFTAVLIGVEYFFRDDAQVFQVVATVLTGFTGAFLGRIKPANQNGNGKPLSTVPPEAPKEPVV